MAKETPSNPGRLKRSRQDIVEPVIPGPSKQRERLEIASPYHMEAHEDDTCDTMERSSQAQEVAPHPPPKYPDLETGASVASQSSIGAGFASTTMDVHESRNALRSSASTGDERRRGGGGGDGGKSEDDTHEREREWEHEWERELVRRAGE